MSVAVSVFSLVAIAMDRLNWPNHVCDLKGWQNEAARAYGASGVRGVGSVAILGNQPQASTHRRVYRSPLGEPLWFWVWAWACD